MSLRTPEHIEKKVQELLEQGNSIRGVAREIRDNFDYPITPTTIMRIRDRIGNIQQKISESEIIADANKIAGDHKKYDIDGDEYVFITGSKGERELIKIPISLVDQIYTMYSRYGDDKSSQQVIDHFGITPQARNLIKNRIGLNKYSDILSPEGLARLEQQDEGLVDKKIKEGTYQAIKNKYKEKYKKHYDDIVKDEFKKQSKILANIDNFLEYLQAYLKDYKPQKVEKPKPIVFNSDVSYYTFSDIHFGMEGTEQIALRLDNMLQDMIADPSQNIHLFCLGDLAETFVEGGMHSGMVESMDGVYGFDLMMFVVRRLENIIIQLYQQGKNVNFIGLGGNHDRTLQNHNQDAKRMGALIVYELVKRGVAQTEAKVNYLLDKTTGFTADDIRFIVNHGDEGFDKRKPEDILWKHGEPSKQNVILHGDKHNVSIKETKNGIMIGTPALANRGEYSQRLDLRSQPGYIKINKNRYNQLDVLVRRMQ